MIVRIFVLYLIIIIKSQMLIISHCRWIGHERLIFAVCLAMFYQHIVSWLRRMVGQKLVHIGSGDNVLYDDSNIKRLFHNFICYVLWFGHVWVCNYARSCHVMLCLFPIWNLHFLFNWDEFHIASSLWYSKIIIQIRSIEWSLINVSSANWMQVFSHRNYGSKTLRWL